MGISYFFRTSTFGKAVALVVATTFLVTSLGIDKAHALGTGFGMNQPITIEGFQLGYCMDKAGKVIGLLEAAGNLGSATVEDIAGRRVFVKDDILDTQFQKTDDQIFIEIAKGVAVLYYDPSKTPVIPQGFVPAADQGLNETHNPKLARMLLIAENIAADIRKKETAAAPEKTDTSVVDENQPALGPALGLAVGAARVDRGDLSSVTAAEPAPTTTTAAAARTLQSMTDADILSFSKPTYLELRKHMTADLKWAHAIALELGVEEGTVLMNLLRAACLAHDLGGVLEYTGAQQDELIEAKLHQLAKANNIASQGVAPAAVEAAFAAAGVSLSTEEKALIPVMDHAANSLRELAKLGITAPAEVLGAISDHMGVPTEKEFNTWSTPRQLIYACLAIADVFEFGNNHYKRIEQGKKFETPAETLNFLRNIKFKDVPSMQEKIDIVAGMFDLTISTDNDLNQATNPNLREAMAFSRSPITATEFAPPTPPSGGVSRRVFLSILGMFGLGALLAGCFKPVTPGPVVPGEDFDTGLLENPANINDPAVRVIREGEKLILEVHARDGQVFEREVDLNTFAITFNTEGDSVANYSGEIGSAPVTVANEGDGDAFKNSMRQRVLDVLETAILLDVMGEGANAAYLEEMKDLCENSRAPERFDWYFIKRNFPAEGLESVNVNKQLDELTTWLDPKDPSLGLSMAKINLVTGEAVIERGFENVGQDHVEIIEKCFIEPLTLALQSDINDSLDIDRLNTLIARCQELAGETKLRVSEMVMGAAVVGAVARTTGEAGKPEEKKEEAGTAVKAAKSDVTRRAFLTTLIAAGVAVLPGCPRPVCPITPPTDADFYTTGRLANSDTTVPDVALEVTRDGNKMYLEIYPSAVDSKMSYTVEMDMETGAILLNVPGDERYPQLYTLATGGYQDILRYNVLEPIETALLWGNVDQTTHDRLQKLSEDCILAYGGSMDWYYKEYQGQNNDEPWIKLNKSVSMLDISASRVNAAPEERNASLINLETGEISRANFDLPSLDGEYYQGYQEHYTGLTPENGQLYKDVIYKGFIEPVETWLMMPGLTSLTRYRLETLRASLVELMGENIEYETGWIQIGAVQDEARVNVTRDDKNIVIYGKRSDSADETVASFDLTTGSIRVGVNGQWDQAAMYRPGEGAYDQTLTEAFKVPVQRALDRTDLTQTTRERLQSIMDIFNGVAADKVAKVAVIAAAAATMTTVKTVQGAFQLDKKVGEGGIINDSIGSFKGPSGISMLKGIAVAEDGSILVVNAAYDHVRILNPDGTYKGEIGNPAGRFNTPTNIAIGKDGRIVVANSGNGSVSASTPDRPYYLYHEISGSSVIGGVAINGNGRIFVVNKSKNAVYILNSDGTFNKKIDQATSKFDFPQDIAIAQDGRIFVTNWGNNTVSVLNPDGTLNSVIDQATGRFDRPRGIAIAKDGRIFVANHGNSTVSVLNPDGTSNYVIDQAAGEFDSPTGITIGKKGRILVTNEGNGTVSVLKDVSQKGDVTAETPGKATKEKPAKPVMGRRAFLGFLGAAAVSTMTGCPNNSNPTVPETDDLFYTTGWMVNSDRTVPDVSLEITREDSVFLLEVDEFPYDGIVSYTAEVDLNSGNIIINVIGNDAYPLLYTPQTEGYAELLRYDVLEPIETALLWTNVEADDRARLEKLYNDVVAMYGSSMDWYYTQYVGTEPQDQIAQLKKNENSLELTVSRVGGIEEQWNNGRIDLETGMIDAAAFFLPAVDGEYYWELGNEYPQLSPEDGQVYKNVIYKGFVEPLERWLMVQGLDTLTRNRVQTLRDRCVELMGESIEWYTSRIEIGTAPDAARVRVERDDNEITIYEKAYDYSASSAEAVGMVNLLTGTLRVGVNGSWNEAVTYQPNTQEYLDKLQELFKAPVAAMLNSPKLIQTERERLTWLQVELDRLFGEAQEAASGLSEKEAVVVSPVHKKGLNIADALISFLKRAPLILLLMIAPMMGTLPGCNRCRPEPVPIVYEIDDIANPDPMAHDPLIDLSYNETQDSLTIDVERYPYRNPVTYTVNFRTDVISGQEGDISAVTNPQLYLELMEDNFIKPLMVALTWPLDAETRAKLEEFYTKCLDKYNYFGYNTEWFHTMFADLIANGSNLTMRSDLIALRAPQTYEIDLNTGTITYMPYSGETQTFTPADGETYMSHIQMGFLSPLGTLPAAALDATRRQQLQGWHDSAVPADQVTFQENGSYFTLSINEYPFGDEPNVYSVNLESGVVNFIASGDPASTEYSPGEEGYAEALQSMIDTINTSGAAVSPATVERLNELLTGETPETPADQVTAVQTGNLLTITIDNSPFGDPDVFNVNLDTGDISYFEAGDTEAGWYRPSTDATLEDVYTDLVNQLIGALNAAGVSVDAATGDRLTELASGWQPEVTPEYQVVVSAYPNGAPVITFMVDAKPFGDGEDIYIVRTDTGMVIFTPYGGADQTYTPDQGEAYTNVVNGLIGILNIAGTELDEASMDRLQELADGWQPAEIPAFDTNGLISNVDATAYDPFVDMNYDGANVLTMVVWQFPWQNPPIGAEYIQYQVGIDFSTGVIKYAGPNIPWEQATEYAPGSEGYTGLLQQFFMEPLMSIGLWESMNNPEGTQMDTTSMDAVQDEASKLLTKLETLNSGPVVNFETGWKVPGAEASGLNLIREGNEFSVLLGHAPYDTITSEGVLNLETGDFTYIIPGYDPMVFPTTDESYLLMLETGIINPLNVFLGFENIQTLSLQRAQDMLEAAQAFYDAAAVQQAEKVAASSEAEAEKEATPVSAADEVVVAQQPMPAGDHPAVVKNVYNNLPADQKLSINQIIASGTLVLMAMGLAKKADAEGLDKQQLEAIAGYMESNQAFLTEAISPDNPKILRAPVEYLKGPEGKFAVQFLSILNTPGTGIFVELFEPANPDNVVSEDVYKSLGLEKKEFTGKERTRANTISLFAVDESIEKADLHGQLQLSETLRNSLIVPFGIKNDPVGMVRATLFGLRLSHIANNPNDRAFIEETINMYRALAFVYTQKALELTVDDILAFVQTNDVNAIVRVLKKIIESLPMDRLKGQELINAQEVALRLAHAA